MGCVFRINSTKTFTYRSLQHWDTEWIKAGDEAHKRIFSGENVSCAFTNSVEVTATELFIPNLNLLMSNNV